jgi:hypothetical protein
MSNNEKLADATITVTEPVKLPKVIKFEVSQNSIEAGKSITLTWQVENAASVQITDIGAVPPQGSRPVSPVKNTTYQLTVNGSPLSEQTVEVHEAAKPQQEALPQGPTPSGPTQSAGPDVATLQKAVGAYERVFQQASGKNAKDCKAVFSGAYGGRLSESWSDWCSRAKSFSATNKSCRQGGSADAPTLTCEQTILVYPKDGDTQKFSTEKTFRFTKGADGSWQVSGW